MRSRLPVRSGFPRMMLCNFLRELRTGTITDAVVYDSTSEGAFSGVVYTAEVSVSHTTLRVVHHSKTAFLC